MRYYSASFIFAVGVGLLILGLCFIVAFQLHYGSSPVLVKVTFCLIGVAVPLVIHGINMMLGFKRYSLTATLLGFALSIGAVFLFVYLYPNQWFYPNVTYVAVLYTVGLIMLLSGAFAEAVVSVIEKGTKTIKKVIVHERVHERFEKPKPKEESLPPLDAKFAHPTRVEPEIEIRDVSLPPDFKPGKALEKPRIGRMVKVKDHVSSDAEKLIRVREGEFRVKKADTDILKDTKALKSIGERMGKEDRKRIFGG